MSPIHAPRETVATKKKTKTEPKKKHVDNPNVIGLHSEVMEQPITQTLEQNYMPYAMSTERVARIPGNRRLQAVAPQAALHHVQNGPVERRAPKRARTSSAKP